MTPFRANYSGKVPIRAPPRMANGAFHNSSGKLLFGYSRMVEALAVSTPCATPANRFPVPR